MGNTFFFNEASKDNSAITWKDIFSETFKKHTKAEAEYALSAGTQLNTATRDNMLQKWQKPWLWARVLGGGVAICLILYAAYILPGLFSPGHSVAPALVLINFIFPPFVSAFAVMTLLWEMNIPRNISIYAMLGYFLIGGVMSIALTQILFSIGVSAGIDDPIAPLTEEPGKCLVSFLFLVMASKQKRIYGLTGLTIGAGVGAGFTTFESIQYAFMYSSSVEDAFALAIQRSIPKIGGHILYCAPYVAGLALAYAATRDWKKVWFRKEFLIPFVMSFIGHAVWNYNASSIRSEVLKWIIAVAMWYELLYMTRKCLTQAVRDGRQGNQPAAVSGVLTLSCINGSLNGRRWHLNGGVVTIGRDASCSIQFPQNTPGVSRIHCAIERTQSGWTVRDLNSSNGTYLTGGRLNQRESRLLSSGEIIYLGSRETAFRVQIG